MTDINTNLIDNRNENENEINILNKEEWLKDKQKDGIPEKIQEVDKEKERLIKKLENLKNQLEDKDKETIKDVYLSYSEEQILENREVKRDKINITSKIFYKALLFLITSIYLIGTFLIISLKNSFWNLFKSSLKCYFNSCDKKEFLKQANFFEYFHEQLLKEPMDLNLIMFWNFIGIKLSSSIGLRLSAVLILFVNFLILTLTYNINYNEYDSETCKYSIFKIVLLFFNWIFMAISFGASSLLSQQKFLDFYLILDDEDDNVDKNKDNNNRIPYQKLEFNENINDLIINEDSDINDKNQSYNMKDKIEEQKNKIKRKDYETLFLYCLATLFGYSGKYGIAFYFYNGFNNTSTNETIYNNTNDINMINNLIFYLNNSVINDTIYNYDLNKNNYIKIFSVYIGCILISAIFLYSLIVFCFFKKKEKKEEESSGRKSDFFTTKFVCEICGCIIYFERVILDEKETIKNMRCYELCCESINNYYNNIICNMCNCRKNMEYQFNENIFDKKTQCFCYCFQVKSFCFWINKYFINQTQKEIFLCTIILFITRLSSVGCEKRYEEILNNGDIFKEIPNFLFNLFLLLSVYIFITILNICCGKKDIEDCFGKIDSKKNEYCNGIFNRILVWSEIINILIVLILSEFHYSLNILFGGKFSLLWASDEEYLEKFNLFGIVIAKIFIVFLLNYYCLITAKNKTDFELFSQTILVTAYITIINFFINLIKNALSFEILLIVQSIFPAIISIILGYIIIKCLYILLTCCCFYDYCYYDHGIVKCEMCCCDIKSSCYSECCNSKCSKCNCSYLCCVPCSPIIIDCCQGFCLNLN